MQLDISGEFRNGTVSFYNTYTHVTGNELCSSNFSFQVKCGLRCYFLQLPGLLSLSTKILPTVMNLIKKLAEEGQIPATNRRERPIPESKSTHNTSSGLSSTSLLEATAENGSEYPSTTKEE